MQNQYLFRMFKTQYYNNIDDLPAWNYIKICETSQPKYLIQKKGLVPNAKCFVENFEKIQSEIIDTFGVSDHYKQIIAIKQELCRLKIDKVVNNESYLETFIDIKNDELTALEQQKGTSVNEIKVYLEKFLGFKINLKEISTMEYFNYLKQLNKQAA